MRVMRHIKQPFIWLWLIAGTAFAFDASLTIQPPLIGLNETASISVEVRGAGSPSAPRIPEVEGLRIVSTGQSQRINWVNGQTDRSITFTFSVQPQRSGEFILPAFEYTVGNQTRTLGPARLEVVPISDASGEALTRWDEMIFATIEIDRDHAYVHEPFTLTLSVYVHQGIHLSPNLQLSDLPESGLAPLQWREAPASREVIDNRIFERRRFLAQTRASEPGPITFSPRIDALVETPAPSGTQRFGWSHPMFDSLYDRMGRDMQPIRIDVRGPGMTIRPLPQAGRPEPFSGGVGRFRVTAQANPVDAEPGDPITVTLHIRGEGSVDRISAPDFPEPDRFRLFGDPVRRIQDNALVFERVVSARDANVDAIPPFVFSYFDPSVSQYKTIRTDPIPLSIRPPSHDGVRIFSDGEESADPPPLVTESELQRIRQHLRELRDRLIRIAPFLAALLLSLIVLWQARRIRRRQRQDTARMRRLHAPRSARKGLRAAQHAQRRGDEAGVDEALWQALTGYFGNRLNLPPGEITSDDILRALNRAGADPNVMHHLEPLLTSLECRRYGATLAEPLNIHSAGHVEETSRILLRCEKLKF